VLTAPDDPGLEVTDRRPFLDPTATYLVTGGLGGFGLRLLAYPVSAGAWHLHQATIGHPLGHFVLFSSIAAVFGHAGQSVYAAADASLDGLAQYRRPRGQPALAYDMAAVAEAAMTARQPHAPRLLPGTRNSSAATRSG
jgi:hypothetical protein